MTLAYQFGPMCRRDGSRVEPEDATAAGREDSGRGDSGRGDGAADGGAAEGGGAAVRVCGKMAMPRFFVDGTPPTRDPVPMRS